LKIWPSSYLRKTKIRHNFFISSQSEKSHYIIWSRTNCFSNIHALIFVVLRTGARAPRYKLLWNKWRRRVAIIRGYFIYVRDVTKDNNAKDKISLPNANRVIVTGDEQQRRGKTRVARNPRCTFDLAKCAISFRNFEPLRVSWSDWIFTGPFNNTRACLLNLISKLVY